MDPRRRASTYELKDGETKGQDEVPCGDALEPHEHQQRLAHKEADDAGGEDAGQEDAYCADGEALILAGFTVVACVVVMLGT